MNAPRYSLTQLLLQQQESIEEEQPVGPTYEPLMYPTGINITMIGDSVTLGSKKILFETFPDITDATCDAEVSRSWIPLPSIIAQMRAAGTLKPVVVLAIAANGPNYPEPIIAALDLIGAKHLVIVVNGYLASSLKDGRNQAINTAIAGRLNV